LKVANELAEMGFRNVQFLKEGDRKTPDLLAEKDNNIHYAEVKRIQNPRCEDEAFRSGGMYPSEDEKTGDVNADFREPLKKKIDDFINDAKEKFTQQNKSLNRAQKLLFLDFDPGIDARLSVNFNPTLDDIFGADYFSQLERTHNIMILPRKYF
jgi:hypothetical protein